MNLLLIDFIVELNKIYNIIRIDKNTTSYYLYNFEIRCFSPTHAKQFDLWLYFGTNEVYYSSPTVFEHCGYFSNKIKNNESETANCLKAIDAMLTEKL